mgnify:FL=1
MSMKFNNGGYNPATSSLGAQINDKFWSKVAVKEARKKRVFSQLGDKLVQPKNYGDTLVKYHELPIIHKLNINDQAIDANGVRLVKNKWYAYDNAGAMTGDANGYATKELAKTAAGATGSIKSGNGNLYGGDTDFAVIKGSFPSLNEEGGKVNAVGMKRLVLEAKVTEFGFHVPFTKKMLDMDTETGLLARISREVGEAQGEIREKQIAAGLLSASEINRVLSGSASTIAEMGAADKVSFTDIRGMEQSLKLARSPKQTKMIDGSTKIGTVVIGAGYAAYVGQELLPVLEDMVHAGINVWKPVESYAAAGTIMEDEIGKVSSTRFIEVEDMIKYGGAGASSTDGVNDTDVENMYVTGGKYDVFPILYVGSDSFGTIGFDGDVARVNTVMPTADAHNDPYGKKGVVAISWFHGILVYRNERIRQILTTAKLA